jgi:hypothetical protein
MLIPDYLLDIKNAMINRIAAFYTFIIKPIAPGKTGQSL